jgi:hypothetical protein
VSARVNGGNGSTSVALVPVTNGSASVRIVSGRGLSHLRSGKQARAALAADIADGRVLVKPTLRQAAAMTGVSVAYAALARRLSTSQRQAVEKGNFFLVPANVFRAAPTNVHAILVKLAQRHGLEALWEAFEVIVS